jgi:aspartyl/asparaginyl beta-hydroxylase (cupin superfamily)
MRSSVDVIVRDAVEGMMTHLTRDGKNTFFDTSSLPWCAAIEAEWKTIRKEMEPLLEHRDQIPNFQEISSKQDNLTKGDQWKLFVLYWFGLKAEENCAKCPETTRLLQRIPGMKSAMFSILAPRKYIPPHRGMYKGVLRYHLGLIVPGQVGNCRIRVGQDIRPWEEGKGLLFDDTNEHEVWNDTDSYRVILLLDIVRPLFFPLSLINRSVLAVASHMKSYTEPMDYVR